MRRDCRRWGQGSILLLAVVAGAAWPGPANVASAQDGGEFDRGINPDLRQRDEEGGAAENPELKRDRSPSSEVPDAEVSAEERDPLFVPEPGVDVSSFPDYQPPEPERETEPPSGGLWDEIELSLEGRLNASAGYDSNVFRSERGRQGDGVARSVAEIELLAKLPGGAEILLETRGEALTYFQRSRANEYFGASFLEVYQPVTDWLDVGLQNTLEVSRQNLLDDNGDLFPRGRFGSIDAEPRLYAIFLPGSGIAVEAGASWRLKDYEENPGVESLDYQELRLDATIRYRLRKSPRTRLKLRYRFRRRDYRELSARVRDSTAFGPTVELHRHQLRLSWVQSFTASEDVNGRLAVSMGGSYNRDTFQNDRSYRELSAGARLEIWLWDKWTRFEVGASVFVRNFVVRRAVGSGGHLRHRLLDLTLGAWQRLLDDIPLAVFGELNATAWRSGDPGEDYDRYVLLAGLELFF